VHVRQGARYFCVTPLLDFVRLLVNNSFQSEPEDPRVPPSAALGEEQEFYTSSQLLRPRTNQAEDLQRFWVEIQTILFLR
jgi:hypothetical protein